MIRPAVLVTGGARRVGRAIAERFAASGWHVVIHYRNSAEEAKALATALPSAEALGCELTDRAATARMVDDLAVGLPDWRCCVASASQFEPDDATALDPGVFANMMRVNAQASLHLLQRYLASARSPVGRRAVAITDQKLANPNPDFFSYTLSKGALATAMPLLAMGAARAEDRVYALAPGAILPSHDQLPEETEVSHRLNLLGRKTNAGEVAAACLFLAEGWLASGETLFVDSGQHLLRQPRDVIYLAREHAGLAKPAP